MLVILGEMTVSILGGMYSVGTSLLTTWLGLFISSVGGRPPPATLENLTLILLTLLIMLSECSFSTGWTILSFNNLT